MIKGEPINMNGDGETSRDFCFIYNVVQANLLAAASEDTASINQVYNVAVGERITLNALYSQLYSQLLQSYPHMQVAQPVYREFRSGDLRHSLADISKARRLLGFEPTQKVGQGIKLSMLWYIDQES
jgi:UDP-N-acetylglucosamine 4-epimerase